jgi:hypothetical protein
MSASRSAAGDGPPRTKLDTLVDEAWERMEMDREAEERQRGSARALVDAMERAAEREAGNGGSNG